MVAEEEEATGLPRLMHRLRTRWGGNGRQPAAHAPAAEEAADVSPTVAEGTDDGTAAEGGARRWRPASRAEPAGGVGPSGSFEQGGASEVEPQSQSEAEAEVEAGGEEERAAGDEEDVHGASAAEADPPAPYAERV